MPDLKSEIASKVLPIARMWQREDELETPARDAEPPPVSKIDAVHRYVRDNPGCGRKDVMAGTGNPNEASVRLMIADLIKRGYIAESGISKQLYVTPKPASFRPLGAHLKDSLELAHQRRKEQAARVRAEKEAAAQTAQKQAERRERKEAKAAVQDTKSAAMSTAVAAGGTDAERAAAMIKSMDVMLAKALYSELKKVFG